MHSTTKTQNSNQRADCGTLDARGNSTCDEHLVVNQVVVGEQEVIVGATHGARWKWEVDDGQSGADARTIVCVSLKNSGDSGAVSESAGLFCNREDALRPLAISGIAALFEVAWAIKEQRLDTGAARRRYFGYVIGAAKHCSVADGDGSHLPQRACGTTNSP